MNEMNTLENMFALIHLLKRNISKQVDALDLGITPMHVRALKIISTTPNCTANDIAVYLERDKAQVTRLLNLLMDKDLITRAANPHDKRSQLLSVSEEGLKVVAHIAGIDSSVHKALNANLSLQEQQDFQTIAKKMSDNLKRL